MSLPPGTHYCIQLFPNGRHANGSNGGNCMTNSTSNIKRKKWRGGITLMFADQI